MNATKKDSHEAVDIIDDAIKIIDNAVADFEKDDARIIDVGEMTVELTGDKPELVPSDLARVFYDTLKIDGGYASGTKFAETCKASGIEAWEALAMLCVLGYESNGAVSYLEANKIIDEVFDAWRD